MLRLSDLCYDLINELNDLLVYCICSVDCFDHLCFRNLICSGFDHDDLLCGRSNGQSQITVFPYFLRRIDDKLAVYHADLCHCTRTVKRNIGNAGRDCSTQHTDQFRTALGIYRHYHTVQSYIISVILRE